MLWVGLTGGIGSGKSTVSGILKKAGIPTVDADALARLALGPGSPGETEVLSHFGAENIRAADGTIDRKKLGALVFENPKELLWLESVVHPLVQEQTRLARSRFEKAGHPMAFYDVPLLFEKNLRAQFDRVVVVGCSLETQVRRLAARNSLNEEESLLRIRAQMDLKEKMQQADDVIWNEGSLYELELQVQQLIQKLKALSSKA